MLRHTFVHLPGVGLVTERRLWREGLGTWEKFLERRRSGARGREIEALLDRSREAHAAGDLAFFARHLPRSEMWRLYPEFRARAAFLDIETTGLDPDHDQVTAIGLLAGGEYRAFVRGRDLEAFPAAAARHPLLLSFNGARFDLPFLARAFPGFAPPAHVDLRYPLARLGLSGGLKSIERQLGIHRADEVAEVDGFFAVILWQRHRRGDPRALPMLLEYLRHDVASLPVLAETVAERMPAQLGFPGPIPR